MNAPRPTRRCRPAAILLVLPLAAAWAAPARADFIFLTDGTVREGTVVEENDQGVSVQVDRGGVQVVVKIERKQIASIEKTPRAGLELRKQYLDKQAAAAKDGSGQAYFELGKWAADNKLLDEATQALRQARDQDDAVFVDASMLLVQVLQTRYRKDEVRTVLREVVNRQPDYKPASDLLNQMQAEADANVDYTAQLASQNFREGNYSQAIALLNRLNTVKNAADVDRATQALKRSTGFGVGELIAIARLQNRCDRCATQALPGMLVCPTCKGQGKVQKERKLIDEAVVSGVKQKRERFESYDETCATCRGLKFIVCGVCKGTGMNVGVIGQVEREPMAVRLRPQIAELWDKIRPYAEDPDTLHKINSEELLRRSRRLHFLIEVLLRVDDALKGPDLAEMVRRRDQLEQVDKMAALLWSRLTPEEQEKYDAIKLEMTLLREQVLLPETVPDLPTRDPSTRTGP